MSNGKNRPLYGGIGSPKLDDVLAQIRQGATQAQGGNILQSLLAEAMKPSGRTGGVPGAGSPGAMLPTRMPGISMPKPPVKDKTAAAREYKKQQQGALDKTFKEYNKGKEDGTPYTIQEFYGIGTANGVESSTLVPIAQSLQSTNVASARLQAADKLAVGKKEAAKTLATAKTEAVGAAEARKLKQEARDLKTKIAEEKRAEERKIAGEERDIEDVLPREKFEAGEDQRRRKQVLTLYGVSEFEALDDALKEKVMEVTVKAKNYQNKEGIDFDDAIEKAFGEQSISEALDKLPEANLGYTDITSNEVETVELVKQLDASGADRKDIETSLFNKGWTKTGNQSIESIMKQAGIEKEVVEQETVVVPEEEMVVPETTKTIVSTGTLADGTKFIEYSDGSIEHAN